MRGAWKKAEDEEDPRMAEIVLQAGLMQPILRELTKHIRFVLRRQRELTRLDRVQEMDRASMVWLSRQPGRNVPERAGAAQRILATVRRENFDTLENRVLHAYAKLAAEVARDWMREHRHASKSGRYVQVDEFRKFCRNLAKTLHDHDVLVARTDITPNYVLMQSKSYRKVYESWRRLLLRQEAIDDLWAWQAEAWTDFAVLAITLAIAELEKAELVAQSPVVWRAEAVGGRWFSQDRPMAVFWLTDRNRIVEIQSRPERPGALLTAARAHVALKITDIGSSHLPRRVAVWTPHAMKRLDLKKDVAEAVLVLEEIQSLAASEVLRHGLILTPARGQTGSESVSKGSIQVKGIALDPSGDGLNHGFNEVKNFVHREIYLDAE